MRAMTSAEREFRRFFTEHYGDVVRFVDSRVHDRGVAEEIANETFRLAWVKFDDLESPDIRILVTLAKGKIRDHRKATARIVRLEKALGQEAQTARQLMSHLDKLIVHDAIEALPQSQRDAVLLFYGERCSTAEIARMLGSTEGAIRTALSRARVTLRAALGTDTDSREGGLEHGRERVLE